MAGKPKYLTIEEEILQRIQSGGLVPGNQIPTEAELCKAYGVSRMTVNKAINSLTQKGYVNRIAGRGSFVTNVHVNKPVLRKPQSFSEDMRSIGLEPGAKLLRYEIRRGEELPEYIQERLNIGPDELIHCFSRLRTGNGTPICVSDNYVPCKVLPAIDVSRLEDSFFKFIQDFGFSVDHIDLNITAVLPTAQQKAILGIENEALLKVFHNSYLEDGRILEYIETYYIGRMYTYKILL